MPWQTAPSLIIIAGKAQIKVSCITLEFLNKGDQVEQIALETVYYMHIQGGRGYLSVISFSLSFQSFIIPKQSSFFHLTLFKLTS